MSLSEFLIILEIFCVDFEKEQCVKIVSLWEDATCKTTKDWYNNIYYLTFKNFKV